MTRVADVAANVGRIILADLVVAVDPAHTPVKSHHYLRTYEVIKPPARFVGRGVGKNQRTFPIFLDF